MSAIAAINGKARETVQALRAWLDLAIIIIERMALLGIAVLLFGFVDAKFALFKLPIPSADMWQLLGATAVWAIISGRINFSKLMDTFLDKKK